jgi:hypothetical protein
MLLKSYLFSVSDSLFCTVVATGIELRKSYLIWYGTLMVFSEKYCSFFAPLSLHISKFVPFFAFLYSTVLSFLDSEFGWRGHGIPTEYSARTRRRKQKNTFCLVLKWLSLLSGKGNEREIIRPFRRQAGVPGGQRTGAPLILHCKQRGKGGY